MNRFVSHRMSSASLALVRYGRVPEVARFETGDLRLLDRDATLVVETPRGLELGRLLDLIKPAPVNGSDDEPPPPTGVVRRIAGDADESKAVQLRRRAEEEFADWERRIQEWNLDLQLIDLEWTLDESKLILYVLNERGPECTKLALQAAAAGFGVIEVQPVSLEGLKPIENAGGGCGSCGCHN